MPRIFTIEKKKVEKRDGRAEVLKIYFESTKELDNQQKESLKISEDPIVLTDLVSQVKQTIDKGGAEYFLAALEASIGEYSDTLLKEYISEFLNKLIRRVETSPEHETDKDSIGSRYVLIYEVLLRFAVILLSEEENRKRDVTKLFGAMDNFGKSLTSSTTLELDSNFKHFLYAHHIKWMACLNDAVKIVQKLNAPTRTFTSICNYFDEAERYAKAHVIAFLGSDFKKGHLDKKWIDETYEHALKMIVANPSDMLPIKTNNRLSQQICLSEKHTQIIVHLQKINIDKAKIIEKLLIFLQQTISFKEMFGAIDALISIGNWMFLLRNPLNIQVLANRIMEYGINCRNIFSFDQLEKFTSAKHLDVLVKTRMASGDELALKNPQISQDLLALSVSESHSVIKHYAMGNLERILLCQQTLGIEALNLAQLGLSGHIPPQSLENNTSELQPKVTAIRNEENSMDQKAPARPSAQNRPQPSSKGPGQPSGVFAKPTSSPATTTKPQVPPRRSAPPNATTEVSSDSSSPLISEEDQGFTPIASSVNLRQPSLKDRGFISKAPAPPGQSSKGKDEEKKQGSYPRQKLTARSRMNDSHQPLSSIEMPDFPITQTSGEVLNLPYAISTFSGFTQEEQHDFRGAHRNWFNQQKQLGWQGHLNRSQVNFAGSFLGKFERNDYFKNATPYCQEVQKIVANFEQNCMERTTPNFRAYLWEQRHQELFCLKYLYAKAIENRNDGPLIIFVSTLVSKAETALWSQYNVLKDELEILERNRISGYILTSYPLDAPENLKQINQVLKGEISDLREELQRQAGELRQLKEDRSEEIRQFKEDRSEEIRQLKVSQTEEIKQLKNGQAEEIRRQIQEAMNAASRTNSNHSPTNTISKNKPSSGVFSPTLGANKK